MPIFLPPPTAPSESLLRQSSAANIIAVPQRPFEQPKPDRPLYASCCEWSVLLSAFVILFGLSAMFLLIIFNVRIRSAATAATIVIIITSIALSCIGWILTVFLYAIQPFDAAVRWIIAVLQRNVQLFRRLVAAVDCQRLRSSIACGMIVTAADCWFRGCCNLLTMLFCFAAATVSADWMQLLLYRDGSK